jgi:hypothetical protein
VRSQSKLARAATFREEKPEAAGMGGATQRSAASPAAEQQQQQQQEKQQDKQAAGLWEGGEAAEECLQQRLSALDSRSSVSLPLQRAQSLVRESLSAGGWQLVVTGHRCWKEGRP